MQTADDPPELEIAEEEIVVEDGWVEDGWHDASASTAGVLERARSLEGVLAATVLDIARAAPAELVDGWRAVCEVARDAAAGEPEEVVVTTESSFLVLRALDGDTVLVLACDRSKCNLGLVRLELAGVMM